jgi:hypothetical protein
MTVGNLLSAISGIGVPLAAILGGFWALYVYIRDSQRKRVELYRSLRDHYRTNPRFGSIFRKLAQYEKAEPIDRERIAYEIQAIDIDARLEFVAFFEDLALIANSRTFWKWGRVLPEATIHYMFGYSAIQCWDTEPFWEGLFDNKNSPPPRPAQDADDETLRKYEKYARDKAYWSVFETFVERMTKCREKLIANPKVTARKLNI